MEDNPMSLKIPIIFFMGGGFLAKLGVYSIEYKFYEKKAA